MFKSLHIPKVWPGLLQCKETDKQLQSYFIERLHKLVEGRNIIINIWTL